MSEQKYRVVFSGDIVSGFDIDDVKFNLAKLTKQDLSKIEKFFTGSPYIIKKDIDYQTALKLQNFLKKKGAICRILPLKNTLLATTVETKPEDKHPLHSAPPPDDSDAIEYVPADSQKDTVTQNLVLGSIAIIIRLIWSLTIGFVFFFIGTIIFIILDVLFPKYSVSYKVLTNMYKWGSCHWFKRLRLEVDEYKLEVEKRR